MVKINFNLRTHQSKKAVPIVMRLRWAGYDMKYPTFLKVLTKNFDTNRQRVRKTNAVPLHGLINKALDTLQGQAQKVYFELIANGTQPNPKELREKLDFETGRKRVDKIDFWTWTAQYIADSPNRINPKTGRVISHRTIQEYNTTFDYLKEFEKTLPNKLDFDTIEVATLKDFRDFLTSVKEFSVNNIAKHIDNLRQFLRAADADKINIDIDTINPKRFTIARENPQDVYLSEAELQKIYALDLSRSDEYFTLHQTRKDGKPIKVLYRTLDRVRDLFLIGCYTGLRVSDYNNIKPYNIKGDYIDIIQYKTKQRVVIPIFKTVREILNKYNGQTPPRIADQKINLYIKEVCRIAGITETVEKQQTKAGAKQSNIFEKWQLITSHTARRSFASNMTKAGYPIQQIMAITGHKKESVFFKYIKLSPYEHAEIISQQMAEKITESK